MGKIKVKGNARAGKEKARNARARARGTTELTLVGQKNSGARAMIQIMKTPPVGINLSGFGIK